MTEKLLRKHYICVASKNASEALMMAMNLNLHHRFRKQGGFDGVQELVEIINFAAIKLRNICELHETSE